jgi:xylulokinase
MLVAGVDSSTQSTKVEIRDLATGEVVAAGSSPHPVTHPPRSEQDPEAWWRAFGEAFRAAGAPKVGAISVAGQQHGMVVLGSDREVLRPAKLWNDTESAPDAGWLIKQLPGGADDWATACGSVPVASFTATKLSWLHRSEPEVWARLAHVVLPHDWITFRLTGELVTDRGDASGTGYWSPAESAYRWDLLALIDRDRDWSTAVPEVLGATEAAGEWNGALVGAGTGDNMAAALGLGLRHGDVMISLGTSGTVSTVSESPVTDPSGSIAGFADATGRFLPLACTLNAMKVTDMVATLLGVAPDALAELALSSEPGAGGVVLLPYLDGERTPNRPSARGVLSGFDSGFDRAQLARAAVEGVACSIVDAFDALTAAAPTPGRVFLVGGGARSVAFRRVIPDLLGRPVVVPSAAAQVVATGAAVQAAAVLEGVAPAEIATRWGLGAGDELEPGPGADAAGAIRDAYAARRDREA